MCIISCIYIYVYNMYIRNGAISCKEHFQLGGQHPVKFLKTQLYSTFTEYKWIVDQIF